MNGSLVESRNTALVCAPCCCCGFVYVLFAAEVRAEAYQALPLLTGCINESLRLFPAAPGLLRIAKQDAVFGEHFIPEGSAVIMDIFSMHRCARFMETKSSSHVFCLLACKTLERLGPSY